MSHHPSHDDDPHDHVPAAWDQFVPSSLHPEYNHLETRRQFFGTLGKGLGIAALAHLLRPSSSLAASLAGGGDLSPSAARLAARVPHFAPRAKRAIYLCMAGGPSQQDMFDWKPRLADKFNITLPDEVRGGQLLTGMSANQARLPIAPTIYKFARHGQCGAWVSELLPWTAKIVDDIAIVKSMHTDAINHDPAITLMQSGSMVPGKACLGSWLSYGLGSANDNLPTFVVLMSKWSATRGAQALFSRLWSSGFLPAEHSGVAFRSDGDPVLYLQNPAGLSGLARKQMVEAVAKLNEQTYHEVGDPEIHARISQYEMAFRMQSSVPDLVDLSDEPAATWDLYGPEARIPGTFTYNCLLARRMAERGVRFTQIFHRGWDQHLILPQNLPLQCRDIDRACYALITDLKQRGLLDDTLVVWGGEFGRTTYCQGTLTADNYGRDHHPKCFTMWLAGAGVKGGLTYGETDDYAYNIVRDPVHVRDLNATLLHLFGLHHENLSFRYQGLDQRLTGVVPARVVNELFV